MAISSADVARLGALARIRLTEQECVELAPELDAILASVQRVAEAAGPGVPMATHAIALTNVFRDDVVVEPLSPEEALSGAPDQEDGRFRVPQILGEQ